MNDESLKKANDLKKAIKDLEDHLKRIVTKDNKALDNLAKGSNGGNSRINFERFDWSNGYQLHSSLLPMAIDDFMQIYIMKVQKKIDELKWEFEML